MAFQRVHAVVARDTSDEFMSFLISIIIIILMSLKLLRHVGQLIKMYVLCFNDKIILLKDVNLLKLEECLKSKKKCLKM